MSSTLYLAGQIVDPTTLAIYDQYGPLPVSTGDYVTLRGSGIGGLVLTAFGELRFFGMDINGTWPIAGTAAGAKFPVPTPIPMPTGGAVWTENYSVDTQGRAIAIDSFGRLWAFGGYSMFVSAAGQMTLIDDTHTWVDCASANYTFLAVNSAGELWSGGNNSHGQCGRAPVGTDQAWGVVTFEFPAKRCAVTYNRSIILSASGASGLIHTCGFNVGGSTVTYQRLADSWANTRVLVGAVGGQLGVAQVGQPTLFLGSYPLGDGSLSFVVPSAPVGGVEAIQLYQTNSPGDVFLNAAQEVMVLGYNTKGRLGLAVDQLTAAASSLVKVPLPGPCLAVCAGGSSLAMLVENYSGPPPDFWGNYIKTVEVQ